MIISLLCLSSRVINMVNSWLEYIRLMALLPSKGSAGKTTAALINPYATDWWLIWPIQNDAKNLKYDWNHAKWVLIWEYSARAIQWIPTWQGLGGFQENVRLCTSDESSLSNRRVNSVLVGRIDYRCLHIQCQNLPRNDLPLNRLDHISDVLYGFGIIQSMGPC